MRKSIRQYIMAIGYKMYILQAVIIILLIISVLIHINVLKQYGEVCLKDFMIACSYKTFLFTVIPMDTFINVLYLHRAFEPLRVIRHRSIRSVYAAAMKDICVGTFVLSAAVMLICVVCGLFFCGFAVDNWSETGSYALTLYGSNLNGISVIKLVIAILAACYLTVLINSELCLIIYRYTQNLQLSYIIGIAAYFILFFAGSGDVLRGYGLYYIKSTVYTSGWNAAYLCAPIISALVLLIFIINMGKPDWIRR